MTRDFVPVVAVCERRTTNRMLEIGQVHKDEGGRRRILQTTSSVMNQDEGIVTIIELQSL